MSTHCFGRCLLPSSIKTVAGRGTCQALPRAYEADFGRNIHRFNAYWNPYAWTHSRQGDICACDPGFDPTVTWGWDRNADGSNHRKYDPAPQPAPFGP